MTIPTQLVLRALLEDPAREMYGVEIGAAAVLHADGRLPAGTVLRQDSIVGSTFTGRVLDTVDVAGRRAVTPQVTGMAYRTGEHRFAIDPHDPLVPGFVLR